MKPFEQEHIRALRPFLPECMVLLRRNGAFPLDGPCRIAAYGGGVRGTVKGGSGSGEVNSRYFLTVEEGLEQAGFTVVGKEWLQGFDDRREQAKLEFRRAVKRRAREQRVNVIAASMGAVMLEPEYELDLDFSADAAIYVLARFSGEGNDRLAEKGDFLLTDSEVRDICLLDQRYERFMLVVNAGGPVDLSRVSHVGNILVMSQLGVESGVALADVLLGRAYPSGKLVTTWARYEDYCHEGDFGERDDTRYREGIYVGYRYFDAVGRSPLFPFGHGLGYTTFSVEGRRAACEGTSVEVGATILNTGGFAGKETLQVYVSCPRGRLSREPKSLVGFAKTRDLAPGESDEVRVAFDVRDLAGYDTKRARYILEPGLYVVLAGTSSADATPCATFMLGREIAVRQARNLFGAPDFEDKTLDFERPWDVEGVPEGVPELHPAFEQIETVVVDYGEHAADAREADGLVERNAPGVDAPDSGFPELDGLTDEELALLNMGAFNPKGGLLSVIGNASQSVAGAAGESTSALAAKGIGSLVMADGPAGLRLARQFYRDGKGVHAVGATLPESIIDVLPAPVRWFLNRPPRLKKGIELQEQYTTALPIATAVAQSFNLEFAKLCGDIVGGEMEEFGVDLWLAPALNIHRNVLCGRNFEYFSEDPLVSGLFAAALTRGVQAHAGKGVTIKHYAANNQETNRYANNSLVSERALREIYLRGFEICVREAAPWAVMTSYNLLNGVHTSERADLVEALRREFGFDGAVMTDWVVATGFLTGATKYPAPDPAKVAAAGCSLFMPGSKKDYEALLAGLKSGAVTRQRLARNAGYLLRLLRKR